MKQEKGFVFLFSILIMAVMLTASLSLARIFFPKLKSVNSSIGSVVASYTADSATELCLYEARKQIVPAPLANPLMTNSAIYTIASLSASEVDVTSDCRALGNNTFSFRAKGSYRGVTRAFEITH